MPKRLTDTDKWKKDWFINLTSSQKLLWFYVLDSCDHAGICDYNEQLFSFHLKEKWNRDKINNAIQGQITWISSNKFVVLDFVKFQYGTNSSMIKTVRDKFTQSGIDFDSFFTRKEASIPTVPGTVPEGVPNTVMVMEKVMVMETVKETEEGTVPLEIATPRDKLDAVIEMWNFVFKGTRVPLVKHVNKKREELFKEALKDLNTEEDWRDAILGLRSSDFHVGENPTGWVADIDYFLGKTKKVYLSFSEKYKSTKNLGSILNEDNENPTIGENGE